MSPHLQGVQVTEYYAYRYAWIRDLSLNNSRPPKDLSPSICEEALDRYSKSDDFLAGVIERHHIEVRDFMILSFVCDQDKMAVDQLMAALGLARETVGDCIVRLLNAELVVYDKAAGPLGSGGIVSPSGQGRIIARRVHRQLE
jgi:hypothetical protein